MTGTLSDPHCALTFPFQHRHLPAAQERTGSRWKQSRKGGAGQELRLLKSFNQMLELIECSTGLGGESVFLTEVHVNEAKRLR